MGMTAEEFRQRRLADRQIGARRGTPVNRENAISEGRWIRPDDVLRDMGTGDMFGGGEVWSPPVTNGYRCEALVRLRGRTTHGHLAQSRFFSERRMDTYYKGGEN